MSLIWVVFSRRNSLCEWIYFKTCTFRRSSAYQLTPSGKVLHIEVLLKNYFFLKVGYFIARYHQTVFFKEGVSSRQVFFNSKPAPRVYFLWQAYTSFLETLILRASEVRECFPKEEETETDSWTNWEFFLRSNHIQWKLVRLLLKSPPVFGYLCWWGESLGQVQFAPLRENALFGLQTGICSGGCWLLGTMWGIYLGYSFEDFA